MSFQLVKSEVKSLTADLAKEFHELAPSPTEREIDQKRLTHLRQKADAGLLLPFQWAAATVDAKRMRVNGQHSSTMPCGLADEGVFPDGLQVHLDDYKVDDMAGLAILFRQFDDRKSSRNAEDVAGAYQGLYTELDDVPRKSAKMAIDGVAYYRTAVVREPVPKGDDRYSLFAEQLLHPFVQWIGEVFSIKTPEMKHNAVVAAMFATHDKNDTAARAFWNQVAMGGVEFEDDAPATVLDNWLKAVKEKATDKMKEVKPAEIYQGCVYAWNACREDKTLSSIKYDTKNTAFRTVSE